jgi:WD40 repeat protein
LSNSDTTYSILIFDLNTGQEIQRLDRYFEDVYEIAFSPDGQMLLTQANPQREGHNSLYVWDVHSGGLIADLPTGDHYVGAFASSRDNVKIAWLTDLSDDFSTQRYALVVYDRVNGETTTISLPEPVQHFALNPNGSLVALGNPVGDVLLIDTETSELVATLTGHAGSITDIEFNADGTQLYTASDDGTLRIWGLGE